MTRLVVLLLVALVASGATINMDTAGGRTAFSTAYTAATQGDTLQWTNAAMSGMNWSSTFTIAKWLIIKGNELVAITNTGSGAVFLVELTNDGPWRINGIHFNGASAAGGIRVHGTVSKKMMNGRIDHCSFTDCRGASGDSHRGVNWWGFNYGVVDHCAFTNNSVDFEHDGDDVIEWSAPVALGTTNAVVVEDCYFYHNTSSSYDIVFYSGQGSRTVVRRSTFILTTALSGGGILVFDVHGNLEYDWESDGNSSAVSAWFSDNFIGVGAIGAIWRPRGGQLIFKGNVSTNISGKKMELIEEEGNYSFFFTPLDTAYYADSGQQITNSWWINNTNNGTLISSNTVVSEFDDNGVPGSTAIFLAVNRDLFFSNALPASITELAYPHPRITADDGGTPPSNVRVRAAGRVRLTGRAVLE